MVFQSGELFRTSEPFMAWPWEPWTDQLTLVLRNATLCATSRDLQNRSTPSYYRGPTQINAWTYSSDGQLQPSWLGQHNGEAHVPSLRRSKSHFGFKAPRILETATYISGRGVVFIPNFVKFASAGRSGYSKGVRDLIQAQKFDQIADTPDPDSVWFSSLWCDNARCYRSCGHA